MVASPTRTDSASGRVGPPPPGEMFTRFTSAGLRPSSAVELRIRTVEHELNQTA